MFMLCYNLKVCVYARVICMSRTRGGGRGGDNVCEWHVSVIDDAISSRLFHIVRFVGVLYNTHIYMYITRVQINAYGPPYSYG